MKDFFEKRAWWKAILVVVVAFLLLSLAVGAVFAICFFLHPAVLLLIPVGLFSTMLYHDWDDMFK